MNRCDRSLLSSGIQRANFKRASLCPLEMLLLLADKYTEVFHSLNSVFRRLGKITSVIKLDDGNKFLNKHSCLSHHSKTGKVARFKLENFEV